MPQKQATAAAAAEQQEREDEVQNTRLGVLEVGHQTLVDQMAAIVVSQRNITDELKAGGRRMGAMQDELTKNTEVTTEVRDLLAALKGGMKVLGWLGNALKWTAGIVAAVGALYTAFYAITHGGKLPHQ